MDMAALFEVVLLRIDLPAVLPSSELRFLARILLLLGESPAVAQYPLGSSRW
jgi:hypothetical protein